MISGMAERRWTSHLVDGGQEKCLPNLGKVAAQLCINAYATGTLILKIILGNPTVSQG